MRKKDPQSLKEVRNKPCVVCGKSSDACHIKSKGSGGYDVPENLISLCREHHTMQHKLGWSQMCDRFPLVLFELEEKGWRFVEEFGRTKLIRVE